MTPVKVSLWGNFYSRIWIQNSRSIEKIFKSCSVFTIYHYYIEEFPRTRSKNKTDHTAYTKPLTELIRAINQQRWILPEINVFIKYGYRTCYKLYSILRCTCDEMKCTTSLLKRFCTNIKQNRMSFFSLSNKWLLKSTSGGQTKSYSQVNFFIFHSSLNFLHCQNMWDVQYWCWNFGQFSTSVLNKYIHIWKNNK